MQLSLLNTTKRIACSAVPGIVMTPLEVTPEDFASPFEATLRWMVPDDPNGEIIRYNVDIGVIRTDFSSASQQGRRKRQDAIIQEECILGDLNSAVSVPGTETSLTVTNLSKSRQLAISKAFVIFFFHTSQLPSLLMDSKFKQRRVLD